MGFFKIDDIVAALILSIAMFRRLETLSVRREDNLHVSDGVFAAWQQLALRGYAQMAAACAIKVALSAGWFVLFRETQGVLQVGGVVIFGAWIIAIVMTWPTLTEASAQRRELDIGHKK